jgi:hypothetical protein
VSLIAKFTAGGLVVFYAGLRVAKFVAAARPAVALLVGCAWIKTGCAMDAW